MRRRLVVVGVGMLAVLGQMGMGTAYADGEGGTSAVSATLTGGSIGSRSITAASPVTMSSALNSSTLTGGLSLTVTEAARSGTNAWSVTAAMTNLTNATSDVINKDQMNVDTRTITPVGGGGTSTAPSGSHNMATTATLFSNASQDPTSVYTGTYASSSSWTLSVPNGAKTGAYTGTITLTLVQ